MDGLPDYYSSELKHAGEFKWDCRLDVDCPHCEENFNFLDIDNWNEELVDTQVCESAENIRVECPKCKKEFRFNIGSGM